MKKARLFGLLVCAVFLAHGLAVLAPFQFDDIHQIALNPVFVDPSQWWRFWVDPWSGSILGHAAFFRPLLFTSFLLEGLISGGDPWVYRVVSMLSLSFFALFTMSFVKHLLPRLGLVDATTTHRIAIFTALLVCVHPLYNEAILMASSRSSLWVASFMLLVLTELLRTQPRALRLGIYTILAVLSKETAVILGPLCLLVCMLRTEDASLSRKLMRTVPILVILFLFLLFYKYVFLTMGEATPSPQSLRKTADGLEYAAQGGWILVEFARLVVWPWGLSPVHVPSTSALLPWWSGLLVWPTCITIGLVLSLSRQACGRLIGFGVLWFTLAMMPTLALVPLNTPLAEHRVVLAIATPLMIAALAGDWLNHKTGVRWPAACILLLLIVLSAFQTWPWRSERSLWELQAQQVPESPRAWDFLASARLADGDLEGAYQAAMMGVQIAPGNPILALRVANVAIEKNRLPLARGWLDRALEIEPNLGGARMASAKVHALSGRMAEAGQDARIALELMPNSSEAWNTLGNVVLMQGRYAEAETAYLRALELRPGNREAETNLVMARRMRN